MRIAGDCTEAIADIFFHASTEAHSSCTDFGPSVLSQSTADWLVTSPTAVPCGSKTSREEVTPAKGLPEGNPSRDAEVQLPIKKKTIRLSEKAKTNMTGAVTYRKAFGQSSFTGSGRLKI